MKTTIFKIGFILLLLGFLGASCEKETETENIPVEYTKCPCELEMRFIKKAAFKNIFIFDVTKTTFQKMKELSFSGEQSLFVCYTPDTNNATCYGFVGAMMGTGYICNFPAKVKELEISSSGIYISFSADEFELCEPRTDIAANTYSNLVLTSLERRIK